MAGLYFDEFYEGQLFEHELRRTLTESDNMLLIDVIQKKDTAQPQVKELPPVQVFDRALEDVIRNRYTGVIVENDDQTPMEAVVYLLQNVLAHEYRNAAQAMINVHRNNKAVVGLVPSGDVDDVVRKMNRIAREQGHPLVTRSASHTETMDYIDGMLRTP